MKKYLLRIARILAVLLVVWWTTFVLLSHGFSLVTLIESIVPVAILAVTIVAWRWNLVGGIAFIAMGLFYIALAWQRMPLPYFFIVPGPFILTGIIFVMAGRMK
jgi:hypothetical protein